MNRRTFIVTAVGLLIAPLAADAQPAGKVVRIGMLSMGTAPSVEERSLFLAALRDLGWVAGQNVVFEPRFAARPHRSASGAGGRTRPAQGRCDRHVLYLAAGASISRSAAKCAARRRKMSTINWYTRPGPLARAEEPPA
jgi:hypothetical protein